MNMSTDRRQASSCPEIEISRGQNSPVLVESRRDTTTIDESSLSDLWKSEMSDQIVNWRTRSVLSGDQLETARQGATMVMNISVVFHILYNM
jgi:hypothetical protein